MSNDVAQFKDSIMGLISEAGQAARSINAIANMSFEYMDNIDSLKRQSVIYDAGWVVEQLSLHQQEVLERAEKCLNKVKTISLSESLPTESLSLSESISTQR
ncbi:MAG: hypothetical protein ACKVJE_22665 [Pseudomonadales bacterium]